MTSQTSYTNDLTDPRAVVIDRAGYADHGTAIEHDLATVIGASTITSQDGRYAYYPLTERALRTGRRLGTNAQTGRQVVERNAS